MWTQLFTNRHSQKALRKMLDKRDGNRCLVTGHFDMNTARITPSDEVPGVAKLKVAHIIPFALGRFEESELDEVSQIWAMIYRMFSSIKQYKPQDINDLRNAFLLQEGLHRQFGRFSFYFEPIELSVDTIYKSAISGRVSLKNHDPSEPLPDPALFRVHAAVAKILHTSGTAERVEHGLQEVAAMKELSEDGSSDISMILACLYLGLSTKSDA
ncbi:hypothetical protein K440DRAFT_686426 [Wilcoxina mikolae CBS 423.85]|nr:hypothetical protein K440DRAFT_686426 [Wilcoxina mikolae CBS 423.85]